MSEICIDWAARAQQLQLEAIDFIGGKSIYGRNGDVQNKFSPRDGKQLYEYHAASADQIDKAVAEARASFDRGGWSQASPSHRKQVLKKLAVLIRENRQHLALLECLDAGKPITDTLNVDVPVAADIIDFYAESADRIVGDVYGSDRYSMSYQLRRPIGVVAAIVGWNFPLLLAATKIGSALAAGNSLVLKPSELTSLSAGPIARLSIEAGLPPGVFNVVHGNAKVGTSLAMHCGVDLLSFTGSSETGKKILIAAGESNMKKLILECGGKSPNIVFDDCPDLQAAAANIVGRAFWNQGQVCTASSRILVQKNIKDALVERIVELTIKIGLGDPLDPKTKAGALISRQHLEKVQKYSEVGKKQGAKLLYQAPSFNPVEGGYYLGPVIYDEVHPDHRIAREEIFGPILSILTFEDEADAVAIANSTIYGLSAIIWTRDLGRAHFLASKIDAGWIVVNATGTPQGGAAPGSLAVAGHKQSGVGIEGGLEGLKEYTSRTAVQLFV